MANDCLKSKIADLVNESTPNQYYVYDSELEDIMILAEVNREDYLYFYIKAKLEDGTRSKNFRGKDQYLKAVKYFEGKFKGIKDRWIDGDNLEEFQRYIDPPFNYSVEEAIKQTWSAKMAMSLGYNAIKVVDSAKRGNKYTSIEIVYLK